MFDKVVFAGGGHRCWWQAGFWEQLSGEIELHPRVIGAVSAGAATACLLYANDSKRALAWYERELKGLRSNINWFNLLRRGERLMPHAAIYRKALRTLLGGENFRQLMWRAPEIRVQYSRLPPGMGHGRALLNGVVAYNVEKYWRRSLHPTWGQRMGFTHEVKRVQDCRSERELVDLLVASSCTPPFTPLEMIDGAPCIDGGLVDTVPIGTVADVAGQTLVLMTRRYKSLAPVFARNGLIYVQPSRNVAASSWDYTSPAKYQKTYDLGRRDAVEFLKTFALGRYHDPGLHATASGFRPASSGSSESIAGAVTGGASTGDSADMRATDEDTRADSDGDQEAAEPMISDDRNALEPMSSGDRDPVPVGRATDSLGATGEKPGGDKQREAGILDVTARLADYREPNEAGIAEDLSASQPAESDGQERSGRSLRANRI